MSNLNSIEIDIDVYKAIEAERLDFEETQNEILRRILKLGSFPEAQDVEPKKGAWTGNGVTLPEGTKLRMDYNGVRYSGEIRRNKWFVENSFYQSPSGAASSIAKTKSGKSPSLDGWRYWYIKRPNDDRWRPIEWLRTGALL